MTNRNLKVALTIGACDIPPTYFVVQHTEKSPSIDAELFGLIVKKTDPAIKTPFHSATPSLGERLTFHQREFLQPLVLKRLTRMIQKYDADLIHHHFATWALPSVNASRKSDIPLVVTLHGGDVFNQLHPPRTFKERWHQKNYRAVNQYAELILPVSKFLADKAIQSGLNPNKLHVHYLGVDTDYFVPPKHHVENEIPTIVQVGALSVAKGIPTLLQASNRLYSRMPHKLILVGDGPLKQEVVTAQRQNPHIIYRGSTDRNGVKKALQAADLLVFATQQYQGREEAAGLVTLEAQACGTPVVVNRSGGAPEMLEEGITGFTAERENPDSLAQQIERFFSLDKNSQLEMGRNARSFVVEKRSLNKSCDQLLEFYNSLR